MIKETLLQMEAIRKMGEQKGQSKIEFKGTERPRTPVATEIERQLNKMEEPN